MKKTSNQVYIDKNWNGDLDAFISFYIRVEKQIFTRLNKVDDKDNILNNMKIIIDENNFNGRNEMKKFFEDIITSKESSIDNTLKILTNTLMTKEDKNIYPILTDIRNQLEVLKENTKKQDNIIISAASIGKIGEDKMEKLLNEILPTHEIMNTSGKTSNGDFIISKDNTPDILIEIKNWNRKVSNKDVDKFEKDCLNTKKHSIMISLNSDISNRVNLEIRLLENKYITLYLCNTGYDKDMIKSAIYYIYNIQDLFLKESKDQQIISEKELESIQNCLVEYQKNYKALKSNMTKSLEILTNMNLQYLKDKFSVINSKI